MKKNRGTLLLIAVLGVIAYLGQQVNTSNYRAEKMEEIIKDESGKIASSRFTGEDFDVFMRYNKVINNKVYLEVCDSTIYVDLRLNDTLLTPLGYNLLAHKYSYEKRADTTAIDVLISEIKVEHLKDSLKFVFKDTSRTQQDTMRTQKDTIR